MTEFLPDNFLGLGGDLADYAQAGFAVLPIPYDATASYGIGTRDGPRAIISASQQTEDYDPVLDLVANSAGIATLAPLFPDVSGPAAMHERIYKTAQSILRDRKFLIGLGGDHSITSGLVRAVASRYKKLSVLQIDAHADLRDEYQGSPYSHASVMRRIHDMEIPAAAVGIRSYTKAEAQLIKSAGKFVLSARDCNDDASWIERTVDALTDEVYVTIDIDGFDPAYAPGTGTPEPGGLDWHQVTDLLAAVARDRRVVAADVVEVRPVPGSNVTEYLAARLLYRLIGLVTAAADNPRA